jgi:hypothetical protein
LKILTVCEGGTCRSVTIACLLRYHFRGDHDVIPMSLAKTSEDTRRMLYHWADHVHTVDAEIHDEVCSQVTGFTYASNYPFSVPVVSLIPIGRDMWGRSMHPDLVPIVHDLLIKAGYEPRKTADEIIERSQKYSKRRRGEA